MANFFLDKAEEEGIGVSLMKLLKLVYIGYGWMIAVLDRAPFDEPIEAWEHGPVIPSLYHEFKHFRRGAISSRSGILDLDELKFAEPRILPDDTDAEIVLSKVWDVYKYFDAWDLRAKTHEPNTPWGESYEIGRNNQIRPEIIKAHFDRKIHEYLNAANMHFLHITSLRQLAFLKDITEYSSDTFGRGASNLTKATPRRPDEFTASDCIAAGECGCTEFYRYAGKWRPIETAPKDGTRIIVGKAVDGDMWWASSAYWFHEPCPHQPRCKPGTHQGWTNGADTLAPPTHWMPLPPPPKEDK